MIISFFRGAVVSYIKDKHIAVHFSMTWTMECWWKTLFGSYYEYCYFLYLMIVHLADFTIEYEHDFYL